MFCCFMHYQMFLLHNKQFLTIVVGGGGGGTVKGGGGGAGGYRENKFMILIQFHFKWFFAV